MQTPKLMLVTQKADRSLASYLDFIQHCVCHGVDAVQLREKNLSDTALFELGKALKKLLSLYHVPLIINDNLKLCIALDADGVHLGQGDGSCVHARKILGNDKLIGLTVDTMAHIETANAYPVDYLGVGTIFPTKNKPNITTTWGIEGLNAAVSLARHPIIAIGGIQPNNAAAILRTGVHGIAAIGAFHECDDPANITIQFKKLITGDFHANSM